MYPCHPYVNPFSQRRTPPMGLPEPLLLLTLIVGGGGRGRGTRPLLSEERNHGRFVEREPRRKE